MISESEITVRGHGVHTAFLELVNALTTRDDCEVIVNKFLRPVKADITHIHTIGLPSLMKLLFGGGKKVVSAHVIPASLVGSIKSAHVWLPLAKAYMKFFYTKADKVLAVSKMVAQSLNKELGIAEKKIAVTYNTIDTSQYRPSTKAKKTARETLNIDEKQFVVVGNGQVQPRKRFDVFLEMAKDLPEIRFFWVGGIPFKSIGADYKKMQLLIDSAPKNLTVTGVIELEEVKKYLHGADVFILPAEQENHPMAVIEAAASELPIILRDIPEYDDTFGKDILRCTTLKEFESAVCELKQNHELYKKYQSGSKRIAKRFDSAAGAEQMVGIYKELLA